MSYLKKLLTSLSVLVLVGAIFPVSTIYAQEDAYANGIMYIGRDYSDPDSDGAQDHPEPSDEPAEDSESTTHTEGARA